MKEIKVVFAVSLNKEVVMEDIYVKVYKDWSEIQIEQEIEEAYDDWLHTKIRCNWQKLQ